MMPEENDRLDYFALHAPPVPEWFSRREMYPGGAKDKPATPEQQEAAWWKGTDVLDAPYFSLMRKSPQSRSRHLTHRADGVSST